LQRAYPATSRGCDEARGRAHHIERARYGHRPAERGDVDGGRRGQRDLVVAAAEIGVAVAQDHEMTRAQPRDHPAMAGV
jgi:hypothetical protein